MRSPGRPLRHLHAEHPLDGEHHAELGGERREPVVPVGEHDDLPVVADLEQLLDAAVHVADDRLAVDDPLAVEGEPQPEHAVGGGVLRADVEDHVLGGQAARRPPPPRSCPASPARTGADADGHLLPLRATRVILAAPRAVACTAPATRRAVGARTPLRGRPGCVGCLVRLGRAALPHRPGDGPGQVAGPGLHARRHVREALLGRRRTTRSR